MNYTSTGAYIPCNNTRALTDLESIDVAYKNNVELVCNNNKSIDVAYNKNLNLMCIIYKSIGAF